MTGHGAVYDEVGGADAVERPRTAGWTSWVGLVVRVALAAVWLSAARSKTDLANFTLNVRNYRIGWPDAINVFIGHTLPFAEWAMGILLLLGLFTRYASLLAAFSLTVFIVGIASAWYRGLTIDCGCFGNGGQVAANQTDYGRRILEDIGFLLMALWLVRFPRTRLSANGALRLDAPQ